MAQLLFLTWSGAGNQSPAIGLAQELRDRRHNITFAGYANQRATFERRGFEFRVLERAEARYPAQPPPEGWLAVLVENVWACREHLDDVRDLLRTNEYDAVVVDCLMFGALAALEGSGIPTTVLVHSAPGALMPPGGDGERFLLPAVNGVRAAAGHSPAGSLWDAWHEFPALYATIPELDPLTGPHEYVGPIFERQPPAGWTPSGDAPLVLASFSTGPAWEQRGRIERTLDALAGEPCRVLVTTSVADVTGLRVPDNAELVPHVPHDEVLPHAVLTITHAGHGTVCASLAHGVPMLCLPNPGADQFALADHLTELGAGRALDGEASTVDIREGAREMLANPAYTKAAAGLADSIAARPGRRLAAERVERLCEQRGATG